MNEPSAEFCPREGLGVGWAPGRRKRVCVVGTKEMEEE